jgi:glycine cleavage system transcriptional repressor
MVSVYGADKPGIVFRVAESLASGGANITDLTSRVIGSDEEPVYALMLEVASTAGLDLESALAKLKDELGVEVTVNPIDQDVF